MWPLLALLLVCTAAGQETCRTVEENPYVHFGSKTAYKFADNTGLPTDNVHVIHSCTPIALWMLFRHGSHNPEQEEFEALQKLENLKLLVVQNYRNGNFRRNNQRMCIADVNLLEQWEWRNLNKSFAGDITSEAYMSTEQLAQMWKNRFPDLLSDNRRDYLLKYNTDLRSKNTYHAFIEGLFRAQAENLGIPVEQDEKKLRPHKFCQAWKSDVEENNDTMYHVNIFKAKQEYKDMISNVSLRLGFNYDIDEPIIQQMYQMCRYNKAWTIDKMSPWCAAFTREDLMRFEYAEDLETYYKYGFGSEHNKDVGCTFVKDMLQFFYRHVGQPVGQQPRTLIQFVEAEQILLTLTALRARRDTAPLTGDNYHTNYAQGRKWTTSTMTPFNANLAAVLYQCDTLANSQYKDKYQVLFLENQRPMYMEGIGCRVGLCEWTYIKENYGAISDKCNGYCSTAFSINSFTGIILVAMLCIVKVVGF